MLDGFIAFDGFFTNIEQTNAGMLFILQDRCQSRAHHGELQQVLCPAIDIGAKIQNSGCTTFGVGQLRSNGWSVNAINGFEQITCYSH